MSIDLYHAPGSAPCHAVRLVAAALGVDLNLKMTSLQAGEHLKPEFLKVNYLNIKYDVDFVDAKKL